MHVLGIHLHLSQAGAQYRARAALSDRRLRGSSRPRGYHQAWRRRYSRVTDVFPAAWATRLADYLCRHTDVPKDIATHRLAREYGLGVHLVQPLLFQHVGTYSVILHHEKNPANVVSAGFSVE